MSNYIDQDYLEEYMGKAELTDLLGTLSGTRKTSFISSAIDRSESEIDGYIGTMYVTPVPASPLVKEWACILTREEIYKRLPRISGVPESITKEASDVRALLKETRAGMFVLPSYGGEDPVRANTNGGSIYYSSNLGQMTQYKFTSVDKNGN